jgi:PAS domain S-box-containing protein
VRSYRRPTTARRKETGADRRPTSSDETVNAADREGTSLDAASPYVHCKHERQIRGPASREMVDCLMALHETSPDFVTVTDGEGRFAYMNASARDMLGIGSPGRLTGCEWKDAYPVRTHARLLDESVPRLLCGETWRGEGAMLDGGGREIPVSMFMSAYPTQDSDVRFISCIARDISSYKQREQLLLYRANHDPATALPNRAALYELLSYAITHGKRYGLCAAALFLDVDNFRDGRVYSQTHMQHWCGHIPEGWQRRSNVIAPCQSGDVSRQVEGQERLLLPWH